jgi:hypothetical protein
MVRDALVSYNDALTVVLVLQVPAGLLVPRTFLLRVQPMWANSRDDLETCRVSPNSTVLDLKVLLYNTIMISPERQVLSYGGQDLQDHQILRELGIRENDLFTMRMFADVNRQE